MTRDEFDKARYYKDQLCKVRMNTQKGEHIETAVIKSVHFGAYVFKVKIESWGRTCYVGCENVTLM